MKITVKQSRNASVAVQEAYFINGELLCTGADSPFISREQHVVLWKAILFLPAGEDAGWTLLSA